MNTMVYIILTIFGLTFGSFVTALTWRLHEGKDFIAGRSECENCHHVLSAFDLIPLLSWLILRGKCRYCRKVVSWWNPALEASTALLFVGSYIYWPVSLLNWQTWCSFICWLFYLVLLVALVVYDIRWMLLPNKLVYPLIIVGLIDVGLRLSNTGSLTPIHYLEWVILGAGTFGGFYGMLYVLSKGRWVGFGDVKLGLFIGIVLGWQQALLSLFLANILGFIIVVPALVGHKMTMRSRIPFGPFLIASFIGTGLFGQQLLNWYLSLILR